MKKDLTRILVDSSVFSVLDLSIVTMLSRLSPDTSTEALFSVAILSQQMTEGHVCVPIEDQSLNLIFNRYREAHTAATADPQTEEQGLIGADDFPSAALLRKALLQSSLVGAAEEPISPLVLDGSNRLYFHRFWSCEQDVFHLLAKRFKHGATSIPADWFQKTLDSLRQQHGKISGASSSKSSHQGIRNALTHLFSIITGGPGSGKTTITLQILAMAILFSEQQGKSAPQIGLLAPTGKAAARLNNAITRGMRDSNWSSDLLAQIPTEASTIHRALSTYRARRHHGEGFNSLLPYDLLIVDEASMVDLQLMQRLLCSLREDASLVLLGDKDQLSPVAIGNVFADLCRGSAAVTSGPEPVANDTNPSIIRTEGRGSAPQFTAFVELQESYRFSNTHGIGLLADAILKGDKSAAGDLLLDDQVQEVSLITLSNSAFFESLVFEYFGKMHDATDLHKAQAQFDKFRILCPYKEGPWGVTGINRTVENLLASQGLIDGQIEYYKYRPLLFLENHYELGLFNGDIGLVAESGSAGSGARVYCPDSGDQNRYFSQNGLPRHETSYGQSIHKSQGSEFDTVAIMIPDLRSRFLSRELLYTAVTRAKERVFIFSSLDKVCAAIGSKSWRRSGLHDYIWPPV
jgi:exodeoxyribonuclease V alpha subunit